MKDISMNAGFSGVVVLVEFVLAQYAIAPLASKIKNPLSART